MKQWTFGDHRRAWLYAAAWALVMIGVELLKVWHHEGTLTGFFPQELPTLIFVLVTGAAMGYAIVWGERYRRTHDRP